MPEYNFEDNRIKLTITGKVLDIEYARKLAQNPDLVLEEIILLDKVQKKKDLTETEEKHLRKRKLIEGRKPNYFISKGVAQLTGQKADYTKNKAFDNTYYMDLIVKFIEQHGFMSRKDADVLLWEKLPNWMTDSQKKSKINNLITALSRNAKIKNIGSYIKSKWVLG